MLEGCHVEFQRQPLKPSIPNVQYLSSFKKNFFQKVALQVVESSKARKMNDALFHTVEGGMDGVVF